MDIEDLMKRKQELEDTILRLNAKQMSIKILINSAYGLTPKSQY
jgi:hypothetical protein